MIWLIVALPFVLTAVSSIRWARVAQQGGYAIGCVASAKRERVAPGAPDRLLFIVTVVVATAGVVVWPLAFAAAAIWFLWPRSIPLIDRQAPLIWDRVAIRFVTTMVAVQFLLLAALFVVALYVPLWTPSLLPLLVVVAAEWTLRMSGTKAATA